MRDIAIATITGNLTRDVELKSLPSGVDLARLRVATTTRRKSGDEWVDKTNYFTVEVFGAQARNCHECLAKGSRVAVESQPDWREWTDANGGHREAVTFKARQILFLDGARNTNNRQDPSTQPAPTPAPAPTRGSPPAPQRAAVAANGTGTATSDDLPF